MTTSDAELLAVFREEVDDSIETLVSALDQLEGGDEESLGVVLRVVHNIKGAARAVRLDGIELLTHALEDGLGESRKLGQPPAPAMIDLIRRAIPLIEAAINDPSSQERIMALVQEVAGQASQVDEAAPKKKPSKSKAKKKRKAKTSRKKSPSKSGTTAPEPDARSTTIRVRPERLDRLMDYSGEFLALQNRRRAQHREIDAIETTLGEAIASLPAKVRPRLREVSAQIEQLLRSNVQELQQWDRVTLGFKESVGAMRMRPLADFVPRWRQLVDRVSETLDRRARFTPEVGHIEIDRQILDRLWDPLMHLLHNAIGHGIEDPEARAAAGKEEVGRVSLSARAVSGQIELEVSDDGAGIDLEQVRRQALSRKLIDDSEAAALSADEVLDLLFLPGFSTSAEVNRISGRGVGLDVVRSRVAALGGSVSVSRSSRLGGASFLLSIPASVVSIRGLLVRANRTTYVLPHANVRRTLRVPAAAVRITSGGAALEEAGARPLRLRWLSSLMQHPRQEDPAQLVIVEVKSGNRTLGVVVDDVAGEEELVTRPLPWNLKRVKGVGGMVVLGNGTLAAVADVDGLMDRASQRSSALDESTLKASRKQKPRLLVVDDSLTSRTLERNILEAAGYEVVVAVNGADGWAALQGDTFDLVVSDVEMPEVDGFELTRQIRSHADLGRLPIILVTSLDRPEDLATGAAAGADEYVVKGRFDHQKLLEAVSRLLGQA